MNCFMCHASIGSNVVTDFGYGGANSLVANSKFLQGDHAYGNSRNAWGEINSLRGTLYVPEVSMTAAQVNTMIGGNKPAMSLKDALLASAAGLANKISPIASAPKVAEKKKITIGYPSEAQILALLPASEAPKTVTVAGVTGRSAQFAGLGLSGDGKYVRNTSAVTCKGDVVIKGTLFLKEVQISTDSAGCRLYVSESVFIQGPVYIVNGTNVQISSSRAILMGFSAQRMGASPSGSGRISGAQIQPTPGSTPGGPWARFGKAYDGAWDLANAPINGVARTQFFDNLVADARKIGSELKDAGDPSQFTSLPPGVGLTDAVKDAGGRLIVDYHGLLLNAPHVHGRYAGQFKGVIIAEAAMLARNPAPNSAIEEFLYDPVFDTLTEILPALSHVTILDLQN